MHVFHPLRIRLIRISFFNIQVLCYLPPHAHDAKIVNTALYRNYLPLTSILQKVENPHSQIKKGARIKIQPRVLNPISSFRYDSDQSLLTIRFVSGSVYTYFEVPQEIYDSFKSSRSKGIFYNQHIKGNFRYSRVLPDRQG